MIPTMRGIRWACCAAKFVCVGSSVSGPASESRNSLPMSATSRKTWSASSLGSTARARQAHSISGMRSFIQLRRETGAGILFSGGINVFFCRWCCPSVVCIGFAAFAFAFASRRFLLLLLMQAACPIAGWILG
jgi:hypothetical protein